MQIHQIDLVPGDSLRVGNRIVTLVAVKGNIAELHVEDPDNGGGSWIDPVDCSSREPAEPAFA